MPAISDSEDDFIPKSRAAVKFKLGDSLPQPVANLDDEPTLVSPQRTGDNGERLRHMPISHA